MVAAMSKQFDSAWLAIRESKLAPRSVEPFDAFTGKESEIHQQIEDELKRRRWYYIHSRCDRKTTQQAGVPDFVIAGHSNQEFDGAPTTFYIEVKRKNSKLSPEQQVTKHVLTALGHRYAVVYSFQDFLDAIA